MLKAGVDFGALLPLLLPHAPRPSIYLADTRHANLFHAKRLSSKIKKSNWHLFYI